MQHKVIISAFILFIITFPLTAESAMDEAESIFIDGVRHINGVGASKDPAKAFEFVSKAANMGFLRAQDYLAYMYEKGIGTTKNYPEALKWYKRASEGGFTSSQYTLGYMYEKGEGVPIDYSKALKYYSLAVKQNDPYAKYQIASMYTKGRGVEKNNEKAFFLYQEAAESDYVKAQFSVGNMYKEGLGIEKNYILAQKWFIIAAERYRHAGAIREMKKLLKKLSSEQIGVAQKLADDWIQKNLETQFQSEN